MHPFKKAVQRYTFLSKVCNFYLKKFVNALPLLEILIFVNDIKAGQVFWKFRKLRNFWGVRLFRIIWLCRLSQ